MIKRHKRQTEDERKLLRRRPLPLAWNLPLTNHLKWHGRMFQPYCTNIAMFPGSHYHPSPHASSSSTSFGFMSIFFTTAGLAAVFAGGFVVIALLAVVVVFDKPFGRGFDKEPGFFFWACASNHPAKSGSLLSSANGTAMAEALFLVCEVTAGCIISSSSFISPQASPTSSSNPSSWKNASAKALAPLGDEI